MYEHLCIDVERTDGTRRAELLDGFAKEGWELFCIDNDWAYLRREPAGPGTELHLADDVQRVLRGMSDVVVK